MTASAAAPFVGRPLPRKEDPPHLTGDARFVADLARGASAVKFVRSPVAAGRIAAIDAPAGALVFTARDLAGVGSLRPVLHRPDFIPVEQRPLADGAVRFAGEAIAAVVAPDEAAGEDLAERVFADIEPAPAVASIEAALRPGAPLVHGHVPANTLFDARIATDGFDAARDAAEHLVEVEIVSHRESHMPLEPRGAYAEFDARSGRVTLYASVQTPHLHQAVIADLLGISHASLRVVAPDVGGGFGQKVCPPPEYVALVWIARHLRRSVAWIEDRRENLIAGGHGRDGRYALRGAFDADGKLHALEADVRCNAGAYGWHPVTAALEAIMSMVELPGPYDLRNYSVRTRAITTNTCPSGTYRGIARPNVTLALERMMDVAARRIGIDPVDIRRRNLIRDFPYRSAAGLTYDPGSYVEALDKAVEVVDLSAFRARQQRERRAGRHLGIGISTYSERTGYGTPAFAGRGMDMLWGYERVAISMDASGHVHARIGASPHGQGLATALSQVIADAIGTVPDGVTIVHGDTDTAPFGWGSFASRGMVIAGGACRLAAQALRERILAVASGLLEAAPEDIELAGGHARVAGSPGASVSLREIGRAAYFRAAEVGGGIEPGLVAEGRYDPAGTFSNACHVAIVAVDPETGAVTIERYVAVEDAGRIVNPMIADGQIQGGIAQGIAGALYEEIVYDGDGNPMTASLMDYPVPSADEIPAVEIHHLETISDATITGAKGLGEGGTIGAPAAILNAISDALRPWGIEVTETPASPARLRAAIRAAGLARTAFDVV